MAILSDTVGMVETWSDGDFSFGDITAPITVGMDLLAAALDPVGALIAAPLGELLDFMVHHCTFISEPLAKLEGSDALVDAQVQAWDDVARKYVAAGNAHAAGINDLTAWTGPASEQYHDIMKATNGIFAAVADGCQKMGLGVKAAGVLVGMVRGFVWDMITQLLTAAIEGAIAALAAAIPTVGASLAAFAGWYTAKVSAIGIKIFNVIQKLLTRAASFAGKCKVLAALIKKAQKYCDDVIRQLTAAQRLAGRVPSTRRRITGAEGQAHVPKGSLPGDTTVGAQSDRTRTGTPKGPLDTSSLTPSRLKKPYDAGEVWDEVKDTAKGKGKSALKDVGKGAYEEVKDRVFGNRPSDDLTRID